MSNDPYKQAEKIIEGMEPEVKDAMYRLLWKEHLKEDIESQLGQTDFSEKLEHLSDAEYYAMIDRMAEQYADGKYDCNLDYWTNIQNLIDNEMSEMEDIERD